MKCCGQRQYHEKCNQRSLRAPTQHLAAVHYNPMHKLVTMVSIQPAFASQSPVCICRGRAGLECKGNADCCSHGPSLHSGHFSPCAVLNPPSHSLISGAATLLLAFQLPLLPSLPKAMDPQHITFQPSSCTSPLIQSPHSHGKGSSFFQMVLEAERAQSFHSIPAARRVRVQGDNLHVLSFEYHSSS